ncbi:hypothetical protein P0Y35_18645 [Kiritimatiellaeota bacterium B1221]|nr:hypothetical protein [Kiritimatiellaeota bacterium B1221]
MKSTLLWMSLIGYLSFMPLHAEPDARAFLKSTLANPTLRNGHYGEQYCWYVNFSAGLFLDAYEAYQNPEWLEAAAAFYDAAIENLGTDPDGYPGWIGNPIGQKGNAPYLTDTVVGDAIVLNHFVRFAEIVKSDSGLNSRFGAKADAYVALATKIAWDKFESRGQTYQCEDGYVSYPTYHKMIDAETGEWVEFPSRVISNNLNKHYDIGITLLRLWRVTGREEFKERAMRIFARNKSMLRYYPEEDRVVWNFWMPHGPYDIEGSSTKSWVSVHPSRSGYQNGEVKMFVEMYDSGLVYTPEDLMRMVRTNLWMAEHGWKNAEGGTAGQLWTPLVRFSPELRKMYEKKIAMAGSPRDEIARDYFQNVTAKHLNFDRLYVKDPNQVMVVNPPLQPGVVLSMALPIPNRLALQGGSIQLACKVRKPGELRIELLASDKQTVLKNLYTTTVSAPTGGYEAPLWDGSGAEKPGEYYIRWSINGESRMERVVVVKASADTAVDSDPALKPGQSVAVDFEKELDERIWTVENAEVSEIMAHGGKASLEVKRNAVLKFGRDKHKDLPVKVSMWVYDHGVQHRGNGNGPAWGILDTLGNKFCIRMVWRGYLNGNQQYSWLNTGENQWFTPHGTGIGRNKGWNQWVFDFTGERAVISLNGKEIREADSKFIPEGAVGIYLLNGNPGGPLYVDDVEVVYP